MRPAEILLFMSNLMAYLSLAIPLPFSADFSKPLVGVAFIMAILQVTTEGPRWQLLPAYSLAAGFALVWILHFFFPGSLLVSPLLVGIGIVLGALATLASLVLPLALPVFAFPQPTGPYAIGTTTYHWVDANRPELFTAVPNAPRELMAQVWYPAQPHASLPPAPYLPDAEALTPALAALFHLPRFFLAQLRYVTTHAAVDTPVAEEQARYPVLIYLTGLHGFRQVSTFQIEALVSHGYIVVGLDQPGAAALVRFPDGREVPGLPQAVMQPLIQQSAEPQQPPPMLLGRAMPDGIAPYLAADVSFTLDQLAARNAEPGHRLTGRLDLAHAGVLGVSLGGLIGAEACLNDARPRACLIMDVLMSADVVREGLRQPAMWITRDAETMRLERERAGGWTEKDIAQHQTTMRAVYESLPGDGYYLQIPGMFHLNLTDAPYWSPLLSRLGLIGPLNRQRVFEIVNAYSVAFFDKHLKGQRAFLLRRAASPYPEARFETRRPPEAPTQAP